MNTPLNIRIRFQGGLTDSQKEVFRRARDHWKKIINGPLPRIWTDVGFTDGVIIDAQGVYIDGPGGILGEAGPTYFRPGGLPARGVMRFDTADLKQMQTDGILDYVILHEMGHVLGIGTIWDKFVEDRNGDPQYVGPKALAEYRKIMGSNDVMSIPVENMGKPNDGTYGGHWRESTFDTELMTGFAEASGIPEPLSRMTIAVLDDLGYKVNYTIADEYQIPGVRTLSRVRPKLQCRCASAPRIIAQPSMVAPSLPQQLQDRADELLDMMNQTSIVPESVGPVMKTMTSLMAEAKEMKLLSTVETGKPLRTDLAMLTVQHDSVQETQDLAKSPFLIAIANMSQLNAAIDEVSLDGGGHWSPVQPPIRKNCSADTVEKSNLTKQYAPLATVSSGVSCDVAVRWTLPNGKRYQGQFKQFTASEEYSGIILGFTD